jgi:ribonucleoside-diphosphate reductase alpha chain
MATKFLSPEAQYRAGVNLREEPAVAAEAPVAAKVEVTAPARPPVKTSEFAAMRNQEDAPPCSTCGSIMIRSGSCYKCSNCGTTSGCA